MSDTPKSGSKRETFPPLPTANSGRVQRYRETEAATTGIGLPQHTRGSCSPKFLRWFYSTAYDSGWENTVLSLEE